MLVFLAYLALTLILTYPLALRLATHIPGGNVDEGAFLWNIWWMKHALLDAHMNPLVTDVIFYPLGVNLALYTLTPLLGVLALPITLTAGPIVASNILFILGFALSGLAAYLLALDVLVAAGIGKGNRSLRQVAAFVAGAAYTFASGHFVYAALGQYDYVSMQWLPLTVLFIVRLTRRRGLRAPILAGLFAVCAGLTEMNFVIFLAVFVCIWVGYVFVRRRDAALGRDTVLRAVIALAVFVIGFGPLALAVVQETARVEDYLVRGWGGADRFVVDVLGPFIPSSLHPVLGERARTASRHFSDINFGFVGYAALLLAAVGVFSKRLAADGLATDGGADGADSGSRAPLAAPRFWLVVALAFFVLALGPLLHINGQAEFDIDGLPVNIPLPYIIFHYVPFLKGARIPGRFAIMATLAVAVLVALGMAAIAQRTRRPVWLGILLTAIIVAENMALPLPLTYAAAPEPYRRIAAEKGDFAILQIPLGWRDGFGTVGRERTLLQSYQSVHGKRLLAGNTSRTQAHVLPYFASMPVLGSLAALEEGRTLSTAQMEADRSQAAAVLSFLDVRYVVIHGDYVGSLVDQYITSVLPVERLATGRGEVENSFWRFEPEGKWVEKKRENADWVLYVVRLPLPTSQTTVDIGTLSAQMHLAAGWSRPEVMGETTFAWANARQALVLVQRQETGPTAVTLRAAPLSYPGAPQQSIRIAVNGHGIGTITMGEGWQEYRLSAPAAVWRTGINHISLSFAHLASPAQVMGSSDQRTLAAAVDWLRVEAIQDGYNATR